MDAEDFFLLTNSLGIYISEYFNIKWNMAFYTYLKKIKPSEIDVPPPPFPHYSKKDWRVLEDRVNEDRKAILEIFENNAQKGILYKGLSFENIGYVEKIDSTIENFIKKPAKISECIYFGNRVGVRFCHIESRHSKKGIQDAELMESYKSQAAKGIPNNIAREIEELINPIFDSVEAFLNATYIVLFDPNADDKDIPGLVYKKLKNKPLPTIFSRFN